MYSYYFEKKDNINIHDVIYYNMIYIVLQYIRFENSLFFSSETYYFMREFLDTLTPSATISILYNI